MSIHEFVRELSQKVADPTVVAMLSRLVDGQTKAIGSDLVGSYLFGSVATGDFEPGISDVDTVAVLRATLTPTQVEALARLHRDLAEEMPEWQDRVEAVYLTSHALQTFRSGSSDAARISPGEPLHEIEIDHRWLIDWHQLREVGISLLGPPVTSVVPEISLDEHIEAVRRHILDWPDDMELSSPGDLGYAVLSMCRGLRTWRTGRQVSKREGARWASEEMPEYANLIGDALRWRALPAGESSTAEAYAREATTRFVRHVKNLVVSN